MARRGNYAPTDDTVSSIVTQPAATANQEPVEGDESSRTAAELATGQSERVRPTYSINLSTDRGTNVLPDLGNVNTNVGLTSNNFQQLAAAGFSEQRPEIIATLGFAPAYAETNELSIGTNVVREMLDVQMTSRVLRSESVVRLFNELSADPATAPVVDLLKARLTRIDAEIDADLQFLQTLVRCLDQAKRSLSIKANSRRLTGAIAMRGLGLTSSDPARDLFINALGFSSAGYDSFSDTKILVQLMSDIRAAITDVFPNVISGNRRTDAGKFNINIASNDAGLSLAPRAFFTQPADPVNMFDIDEQRRYLVSMQDLSGDARLRYILFSLSREMRASAGLANPTVKRLMRDAFNVTQLSPATNVFDDIIGIPPRDVRFPTIDNTDARSLMDLVRVDVGDGKFVLPFEASPGGNASIIAGHDYYVDSIVKGRQKLDTTAYKNYSTRFSASIRSFATIIEGMFDVNAVNTDSVGLDASTLLIDFLAATKKSFDELSTDPMASFAIMLLRFAASNENMRRLIVAYVVQAGIDDAERRGRPAGIFTSLASVVAPSLNAVATTGNISRLSNLSRLTSRFNDAANAAEGAEGSALRTISVNIMLTLYDFLVATRQGTTNAVSTDNINFVRMIDAIQTLVAVGVNSSSFVLREIIEFIWTLDSRARRLTSDNSDDYMTATAPLMTEFRGWGAHSIVYMVVDAFISFFSQFNVSALLPQYLTLQESRSDDFSSVFLMIQKHHGQANILRHAVSNIVQNRNVAVVQNATRVRVSTGNQTIDTDVNDLISRYHSIHAFYNADDEFIRSSVRVLLSIGDVMKNDAEEVVGFFDRTGPNAVRLNALVASDNLSGGSGAIFDQMQMTLSRNALLEARANRAAAPLSPFVDDTVVPISVMTALTKLLQTKKFRAPDANDVTLLSVALPTRFTNTLIAKDFTQSDVRSDLIFINVHMKDMLFEDVIYKPKKFVFQAGRFVCASDFTNVTADDVRSYDALVENVIQTRAIDAQNVDFVAAIGMAATRPIEYDELLSGAERRELVHNHITSYLLKVYMKLLTSIDMNEDAFYVNDSVGDVRVDPETQTLFEQLLIDRVSTFAGRDVSLDEIRLANVDVDYLLRRIAREPAAVDAITRLSSALLTTNDNASVEIAGEISSFISSFGPRAVFFGAGARRSRITAAKLFERIFIIPVDPDDFEIDEQAMQTTTTGAKMIRHPKGKLTYRKSSSKELTGLTTGMGFEKTLSIDPELYSQLNDVSLIQFFVTIERPNAFDVQAPDAIIAPVDVVSVRGTTSPTTAPAPDSTTATLTTDISDLTAELLSSPAPAKTVAKLTKTKSFRDADDGVGWSKKL